MTISKKSIRTLGLVLTTVCLIQAIIAIILAGIYYRYAGPNFGSAAYYAIPGTSIACIIFSFFVLVFQYIAFLKPNVGFSIATAVLVLASLLFNFAIAIYVFVGARLGWIDTFLGCQSKFQGVFAAFNYIDTYMQIIDQSFCSPACPCYITNSAYSTNSTIAPYYNLWTKSAVTGAATAFQNCSQALQTYAYKEAARRDIKFAQVSNFDVPEFYNYMMRIEENFDCTGWCSVEYYNANYNKYVLMSKYLFSDINRGPPQYYGCLNVVGPWLRNFLNAWGAMTMVLFGAQCLVLALLVCQIQAREKDHEQQIPHHHDDNRA